MHGVHGVVVLRAQASVVGDDGEADEEGGHEDLAMLVQHGILD